MSKIEIATKIKNTTSHLLPKALTFKDFIKVMNAKSVIPPEINESINKNILNDYNNKVRAKKDTIRLPKISNSNDSSFPQNWLRTDIFALTFEDGQSGDGRPIFVLESTI